ncbi:MAG: hypothetical protein Q7V40_15105 [Pseudolabrys sp.]|nr:hypothetical protein [Pseudolabrys sp.]
MATGQRRGGAKMRPFAGKYLRFKPARRFAHRKITATTREFAGVVERSFTTSGDRPFRLRVVELRPVRFARTTDVATSHDYQ